MKNLNNVNLLKLISIDMIVQGYSNRASLHSLFSRGQYRFSPMLRFFIPKPNKPGQWRALTKPNRVDRPFFYACLSVLSFYLDERLSDHSCGFRPGRGIHTVHSRIKEWPPLSFLLQVDVVKCFDNIDHRMLLTVLHSFLGPDNNPLLMILKDFLECSIYDRKGKDYSLKGVGIPQGSPISPLLMNLFLDSLDRAMASKWCWLQYERYADDMILGISWSGFLGVRRLEQAKRYLKMKGDSLKLKFTSKCIGINSKRITCLGLRIRLNHEGRLVHEPPYARWGSRISKQRAAVFRLKERLTSYLNMVRDLVPREGRVGKFLAVRGRNLGVGPFRSIRVLKRRRFFEFYRK